MPKLVFHAQNPGYIPDNIQQIINGLQQAGFLGDKWEQPESVSGERYLVGEAFLSLVTFMGCAPAIALSPEEVEQGSTDFCHIEIEAIRDDIEFVRGADHLVCRCPHCRQRHANWGEIPESMLYHCDECGTESHLSEFDWKNTAGCGHFFISLHGIYPQEALPTESLMQTFKKITDTKWSYFYIQ